jgi:peptidoglycan glycosyltransferase
VDDGGGEERFPYEVASPDGLPWTAFRRHYEGGSIVKLITLSAAWRNEVDPEGLFPMRCRGNDFVVDGKILYDWKPGGHGQVEDVVHAMAVSCNTAFARMGLRVGPGLLRDELQRWGFGSPLPGDLVPIERGAVWAEPLRTDWETARAGIGLDHVTVTPVQAALMAAAVAGDGSIPTPTLVLDKQSLYSSAPYAGAAERSSTQVLGAEAVLRLRESMRAAVTMPDGTGAGLRVSWTSVGVKTGTSGDRANGYDAIVIGYLPAEQPRVAFGMIAEGAGFAGLEGIGVVKRFLVAWRREGGELVRRLEAPQ